ncbi:hypothetical protein [Pseudoruegeria sp. SK021]|uniref:hypothetical protein n=1 Tax=Pseudoruegeria sp. SK021 TaxID=1933035 RepID=UPI000A2399A2|nr:hypothetical protein [Pseudoruegeria sp. SK021]OSP56054.1 hypothetical protein BV911_03705 [Pseudoruegeria sp. SK021]
MTTGRLLRLLAAITVIGGALSLGAVWSPVRAVEADISQAEAGCIARVQQRGGGVGVRAITHSVSDEGLATISLKGVGNSMWTCIAHADGSVSFLSRNSAGHR